MAVAAGFRVVRLVLWAVLCSLGALLACSLPVQAAPLRVVASFSILGDMVREVGGDDVSLTTIVGPLGDPHVFEPSPTDARALGAARVLVVNGLGFESWMPRLIAAAGFHGLRIVASQGVQPLELAAGHEGEVPETESAASGVSVHGGTLDPHAWQDLANGVRYVRNIAQGLVRADPAHAGNYEARAQAYIARLQAADRRWRSQLEAVPAARRILATTHDAFGYFAAAYGVQVLSVVGVASEAEPSAYAMAKLIREIRSHHVRALFLEHGSNSQMLTQVARETGVRLGGQLFADTLDVPGHPASTYLGMFEWNTRQLLRAFTAP